MSNVQAQETDMLREARHEYFASFIRMDTADMVLETEGMTNAQLEAILPDLIEARDNLTKAIEKFRP